MKKTRVNETVWWISARDWSKEKDACDVFISPYAHIIHQWHWFSLYIKLCWKKVGNTATCFRSVHECFMNVLNVGVMGFSPFN